MCAKLNPSDKGCTLAFGTEGAVKAVDGIPIPGSWNPRNKNTFDREFMENSRVYIEILSLTPELLRVFIQCLELYEKAA